MSYRSFKRVLGETHLELKCLFLFGACALALTLGSFYVYGKKTEDLVNRQSRVKGQLLVNTILAHVHWKHLETDQGRELADALDAELRNEVYNWDSIRPVPSPEGKGRPKDEFDADVLQAFLSSGKRDPKSGELEFRERRLTDAAEYQYYQAVRASQSCVTCHRTQVGPPTLAEGDLISVLKVRISDVPVQADVRRNNAFFWSAAIITSFLLVVASYVIIRYVIAKPLKHLQDVSDAISRGDMEKRAEIRTGDEFEALGLAFNRMVRHLVALHAELRQVNAALDSRVDELAKLNMQLYELNRLKSDFLATVSHELRTPLNSIIGFSDVLASGDSMDEKHRRYANNIQKSGRMLLDMINDILDLAKIEAGKMEIRLSDFRIAQVVGAQCDMARPLAEKKNIDLEVDVPSGLPDLRQDQGKIQQILNNLLSNAIKFTPEGGRVMVRAGRTLPGQLQLVVQDTGVGIAPEDQTAVFEKFRQGTAARPGEALTREHSGTGLGLSIVKELCKLLGGEVKLQSELGKGSTFTVTLPWTLGMPSEVEAPAPFPPYDTLAPRRRAEPVEGIAAP